MGQRSETRKAVGWVTGWGVALVCVSAPFGLVWIATAYVYSSGTTGVLVAVVLGLVWVASLVWGVNISLGREVAGPSGHIPKPLPILIRVALFASSGTALLILSRKSPDDWWQSLWLEVGAAVWLVATLDALVEARGWRAYEATEHARAIARVRARKTATG